MASLPSLRHVTLPEIQRLMVTGTLTCTQLVQTYLARITEVDHEFNSVIETNPDVIVDAQARDAERGR